MIKERVFHVKGKNLRVHMVYSNESGVFLSSGRYSAEAAKGEEVVSSLTYLRLLRRFRLLKPSPLGAWWDSMSDWFAACLMFPLKPGDKWGPRHVNVGEDLDF
jgi:hypothetical protein